MTALTEIKYKTGEQLREQTGTCLILEELRIMCLQERPMRHLPRRPNCKVPTLLCKLRRSPPEATSHTSQKLTAVPRTFLWYPSCSALSHRLHHSTPASTWVTLGPQRVRLGSRGPVLCTLNCAVQDTFCSRYHKLAQQINEAFKKQQYVGAKSFIYHLESFSSQPARSCLHQLAPSMT